VFCNTGKIAMKHWMVLLLIASPAFAAPTAEQSTDDPDAPFYKSTARGELAEINGSLMAQQRSKNPRILEFSAMIVKDHTAAKDKLSDLAAVNHIELPTAPSARQAALQAKLATLSGDDFDRAYLEWQILTHKDVIELLRRESVNGDDTDARQFAKDRLPTLRAQLKQLYQMPMIAPESPTTPTTMPPTATP
jgi:putative membrane protein